MRKGELSVFSTNNIGVCFNALVDPPIRRVDRMKWWWYNHYGDSLNAKYLWSPRFENIRLLHPVAMRYNLYLFTDLPRKHERLVKEIVYPLGYISLVFYTNTLQLRQEAERFNLLRFLASTENQASVIGEPVGTLFDYSYKYEKEIFNDTPKRT